MKVKLRFSAPGARRDRRNRADLIECATPCYDAQVVGPYPLHLTVLAFCVCFSSYLFCNHVMSQGSLQPNNRICRLPCLVLNLQIYPYNYFIWLQATFAFILIVSLYFIIPFSVIVICSFM